MSTPRPTIAAWWQTASTPATARRGDVRVAHVALEDLGARGRVGRRPRVGRGQQRVENPDVAPGAEQGLDDVRADEAGAAGDEDPVRHAAAQGTCIRIALPPEHRV